MFVRYLIADKIETHKLVWKHESRYFPFAGVVCCEITIYIVLLNRRTFIHVHVTPSDIQIYISTNYTI